MDQLASLSKPKIAILAAFVYTAIMGIGMFYMKTFLDISYDQPEMMNLFWFILIILPIEIIVGVVLWLQIKQVPERAIADLPNPSFLSKCISG